MTQITWRNINGPSLADASRPLEAAGRSIDNMFSRFTDAINRTQTIEDKNWDTGKANRTNDRLNAIMAYENPEAFAEAQKSGALQALLQGGQVDQQAIRGAIDSRLPQLQQRATQGIQYRNTMIDDRTAPLMEAARMAAVNGDIEGAKAALLQAQSAGARNVSQGAEYIDGRKQLGVTRERDTARFKWDGEDQVNQNAAAKDALLTSGVQRDMYRNNMANDNAARALARQKFEFDKERLTKEGGAGATAAIEKQFAAFKENSSMSLGAYGTKEGRANLMKGLVELGVSDDQRDDILHNLNKYYKNGIAITYDEKNKPIRLPLPVSVILEEAASASEDVLISGAIPGWSRKGDDLANNIDKRFGIKSNGAKDNSTFGSRDQELVDEMLFINKINSERTRGLYREDQDKEIKNAAKGKADKKTLGTTKNPF